MNKVTVSTSWLLAKMRENLEVHRSEFAQAMEDYRDAQLQALQDAIKIFKKEGTLRIGPYGESRVILPVPQSHEDDYVRVISMLQVSVHSEQELSAEEFDRYANDKWQWAGHLKAQSVMYNSISGKTR